MAYLHKIRYNEFNKVHFPPAPRLSLIISVLIR